jgi:hypothetical protein
LSKPWRAHSCVPRRHLCRRSSKPHPESGFALLFVYAMAATLAIMLFMELPRVAFESQRDKEELLIDRGEQYTRAVNLFVRKFNRFPADIDALQNTQNLRFLRRKYVDPMTGKDEWRLIHVGPGGVFTDSLVYGKAKTGAQTEQQNFITEIQQTGGNQLAPNQGVNIATRQRQSDQPGAPGDPNNQVQPPQPGFPQAGFPQPGGPQFDATGQPILNPPNGINPNQFPQGTNGFPPGGLPPGMQVPPGVQMPQGQPFPGGVPAQQQGQPFPSQPGQLLSQQLNNPPQGAAGLINQILTTPRPGGLNGFGGVQQGNVDPTVNQAGTPAGFGNNTPASTGGLAAPTAAPVAAQTIGGGLAGVASKFEQDGIKVYKEQTSYNKWEFVYDITKDPARTGGTVPQAAPAPNGQTPGAPNGTASPANGLGGLMFGNPGLNNGGLPPGSPPPPPPPVNQQ